MKIQVGDFRIGEEEAKVINGVLQSGRISEGVKTKEFETNFAKYIGTRHSVAVSSGTSALIAGLSALECHEDLDVKPNTKIITTPITYTATSNAIIVTGFEPIYVDIDKETFGITPDNIKAHLEQIDDPSKYSVILPVHLMGYPCKMDKINKITKECGLVTFEDAAQAHGTIYKGKKMGSWSLLAGFSFYIAHNIQAGEMGAVTTDDPELNRLINKIKANGRMCDCPICVRSKGQCPKILAYKGEDDFDPRFTHDLIGYNFKTMEFQAALGSSQLKKADWIMKRRQANVKYLNERLDKFSDVLQLPKYSEEISYLAYPIIIKKQDVVSRKKIRMYLEKNGVETRPLFGCIPTQQPAYKHLKKKYEGKLPNAEYIGKNGFYIGCHQYLGQDDLDYIVSVFNKIMQNLL